LVARIWGLREELVKRVSYKSEKSTLRFNTKIAALLAATPINSKSEQFEYAEWLPLRVFERQATTGRFASAAITLSNHHFIPSSLSLH